MRLFIAVPLSKDTRENISRLQDELKKNMTGEKIRWVVPENIHLTLKFLGETDPGKVEKISKVMAESIKGLSSSSININSGGVFPSRRRPRILWVGSIEKNENIITIKKNLDRGLKHLGFEKEKREFTPHLTIGRVKSIKAMAGSIEALVSGEINLGEIEVREIQLIESILSPEGAKYEVVKNVML